MSENKSTLSVDDLKKLSTKQLEKYVTGLEGDDATLVQSILDERKASGTGAKTFEMSEAEKALELKKAEAAAAKEALKAEKERIMAEAAAKKAELLELKAAAKAEKEAAKITAMENKAIEKAEKAAIKEAKMLMKAERLGARGANPEREAAKVARAQALAARMARFEFKDLPSKTNEIRKCMQEGKINSQIMEETGYTNKFICDTTWRLERKLEELEMLEKFREKQIDALKVSEQAE